MWGGGRARRSPLFFVVYDWRLCQPHVVSPPRVIPTLGGISHYMCFGILPPHRSVRMTQMVKNDRLLFLLGREQAEVCV